MIQFKTFTDKKNDSLINVLKVNLHGVTVIISLRDADDRYDDQDLNENLVSRYITHVQRWVD